MENNEEKRFVENFKGVQWHGNGKEFSNTEEAFDSFKEQQYQEGIQKYMPIGSVVMVNGNNKMFMIVGYRTDGSSSYDYIGCEYPKGITNEGMFTFDHSDITRIYHTGFINNNFRQLRDDLNTGDKRR